MSDKKIKACRICGAGYVPTSNNQKYCPDCRQRMQEDGTVKEAFINYQRARQPGPVTVTTIEEPKEPGPFRFDVKEDLTERNELPDWDSFVMRAAEILLKYGHGDLVDKTEYAERIREKLKEL